MSQKNNNCTKDRSISIRISKLMLKALDARAFQEEKDRTQIIRDAIAKYLDLPAYSIEDKLQILEKKQVSLNNVIDKQNKVIIELSNQIKNEVKRTDSIEVRVNELRKLMATLHKTD